MTELKCWIAACVYRLPDGMTLVSQGVYVTPEAAGATAMQAHNTAMTRRAANIEPGDLVCVASREVTIEELRWMVRTLETGDPSPALSVVPGPWERPPEPGAA